MNINPLDLDIIQKKEGRMDFYQSKFQKNKLVSTV